MIRETIFKPLEHQHHHGFRLRGGEIKRIETFSDAVFAFAVTLLIVSLEVPKTFEELMVTMRGFLAFAVCFSLLMLIWYQQHIWFRRYALDDITTVVLNAILIFIVLFYVYPLKFVFTLWFGDGGHGTGKNHYSIKDEDGPWLMAIYGLGYTAIYLVFFFMYAHAYRKKGELQLTPAEVFDTRTMMYAQLTMAGIGFGVVVLAMALPVAYSGAVGLFFFAIPPLMGLLHWRRAVIRKRQVTKGQA
jgi:uncharacterized membrane protein